MSTSKETVAWYKSKGYCVECHHQKAAPGKTCCFDCLAKMNGKATKRYHELSDEQRKEEIRKASARTKARREKRKEHGLCILCGKKPAWNGLQTCYECTIKKRRDRKKHDDKVKAEKFGKCKCCENEPLPGKEYCETCYERMKQSAANARKYIDREKWRKIDFNHRMAQKRKRVVKNEVN